MADQVQPAQLTFQIEPVQIGDQIFVAIGASTNAGLSSSLVVSKDHARMVSKALKEAVEKAEVMIVKPASGLAIV